MPVRRFSRAARTYTVAFACTSVLLVAACAPLRTGEAPSATTATRTPTTASATAAASTPATTSATTAGSAPTAAPAPDPGTHAPLPVTALPGWNDDDLTALHAALLRQCALARAPHPWPALCAQLPDADALAGWIVERFDASPLVGAGGRSAGLLTGYYEPIVRGTRARRHDSQVPLYARPADLAARADGSRQRLKEGGPAGAYPTRAQIESRGLPGADVLLWIDDAIDAFFLHVQGSGRVRLPDGSIVRVGFADHNGHAYRAIGRELVERGALTRESVDADAIRRWLRANPAQARDVMNSNPRYVFFRELPPAVQDGAGPPGSLGVPLTPLRSVATDPAFVPPGALLFIDSTHPQSGTPLRRVVVSQDRGAAIVGAVRADLFWGSGDEAGRLAGLARQPLRMWLLWPKGAAPPGR